MGIRAGQVLEFAEEQGRLVATKASGDDPVAAVYGILADGIPTDDLLDELRGRPDLP